MQIPSFSSLGVSVSPGGGLDPEKVTVREMLLPQPQSLLLLLLPILTKLLSSLISFLGVFRCLGNAACSLPALCTTLPASQRALPEAGAACLGRSQHEAGCEEAGDWEQEPGSRRSWVASLPPAMPRPSQHKQLAPSLAGPIWKTVPKSFHKAAQGTSLNDSCAQRPSDQRCCEQIADNVCRRFINAPPATASQSPCRAEMLATVQTLT